MTKVFLILRAGSYANDFGLAHVQLSKVFWENEINQNFAANIRIIYAKFTKQ